jgi:hypothetical protein
MELLEEKIVIHWDGTKMHLYNKVTVGTFYPNYHSFCIKTSEELERIMNNQCSACGKPMYFIGPDLGHQLFAHENGNTFDHCANT